MSNQENRVENVQERTAEKHSSAKDFMFGAIIGGIVGAATALYFSPKTGREIRETLNEVKDIAISKSNVLVAVAKDKSASYTSRTKQSMNKESDFREKEEQTTDRKFVSIEPFLSPQDELQRKLREAQQALEEEEQKING